MSKIFPAKLLLFGEYTVLHGSQALSVPFRKYTGKWIKEPDNSQMSLIPEYYRWLNKVELADDALYDRIVRDFEDGWTYQSDIPVGYGVGSSGAFVAAVYDRYIHDESNDFEQLTDKLAQMEAYFHGSSSGMDPLVSYTGKAVYKNEAAEFHLIDDKGWPDGFKIYLLDSGTERATASLVNRYIERTEDHTITKKIKRELVPATEHAIHFYMNGQNEKLEECISTISSFQREYFQEMIPEEIKNKWDELSSQPGVYMKLCGAGGGGYFLVISANEEFNNAFKEADNVLEV